MRLEEEFIEGQEKETQDELKIIEKLVEQREILEEESKRFAPKYQSMENQIQLSGFVSIINASKEIKVESEKFKQVRQKFQEVVIDTLDYELIFDQVDCRNKLEQYVKV